MPRILQIVLLTATATLVLCWLAFYNGFPLLYSDTGTYIRSGFSSSIPIDRPIFYGLFIKYVSLWHWLWLVILAQSGIVAWLTFLTFQRFVSPQRVGFYFIPTIAIVAVTTGVTYYTGVLIPDIFTPILFLSAFHLAFFRDLKWVQRVPLILFLMVGIATHLSNIPTLILAFAGCVLLGWIRRKKHPAPFHRSGWIALLIVIGITLLLIPALNYRKDGHFRFSSGGSIFMTNRMLDMGLLQEYLKTHCDGGEWSLCRYQNALACDFLWDFDNSPLYKTGGWEGNVEEYGRLNRAILTDPEFLLKYLHRNLEAGFQQWFVFQLQRPDAFKMDGAPIVNINGYLPGSLQACLNSKQIRNELSLDGLSHRQAWVVYFSMGLLLLMAIYRGFFSKLPSELRWFLLTLTAFALSNSFVCASLSLVNPRYQGRMVWLFPFALLLVGAWLSEHYDLMGRLRKWVRNQFSSDLNALESK